MSERSERRRASASCSAAQLPCGAPGSALRRRCRLFINTHILSARAAVTFSAVVRIRALSRFDFVNGIISV